ncbi:MAG: class I SAM-dependent methyltransferase, partial [Alphaproteobacteria bacterium]|nr:class I SAM-dependent methyltransferase [Alphaproteobacteria bacterium]
HKSNLLFQSEQHPLVAESFPDFESFCLSLIHKKAYEEAAALADGATVLDVGCNTGYGAARVAETAKRVVGVDVSARAVATARERYGRPNIEFVLAEGATLPFADASFDLVFSFQVIEHVVDTHAYLSEIVRVLKVGGTALFTTPNRCIRLEPGMKPWNRFHVREYAGQELADVLRAHFEQVEVQGLFASSPIRETELKRVEKARKRAKSRLFQLVRTCLRRFRLDNAARQGVGLLAQQFQSAGKTRGDSARTALGSDAHPITNCSTADLFYLRDRLDDALDLMAVCRTPLSED